MVVVGAAVESHKKETYRITFPQSLPHFGNRVRIARVPIHVALKIWMRCIGHVDANRPSSARPGLHASVVEMSVESVWRLHLQACLLHLGCRSIVHVWRPHSQSSFAPRVNNRACVVEMGVESV